MIVKIPVKKLTEILFSNGGSIFENPPWGCSSFTQWDIEQGLKFGLTFDVPIPAHFSHSTDVHVGRICYFARKFQWNDVDPILVDVGIPSVGYYPQDVLVDGWHRYCAAVYLGFEEIDADVSGESSEIERLFGVKV